MADVIHTSSAFTGQGTPALSCHQSGSGKSKWTINCGYVSERLLVDICVGPLHKVANNLNTHHWMHHRGAGLVSDMIGGFSPLVRL